MKCPSCEAEMAPMTLEGVELDFCDKCGGCWFDNGELAIYTETSEDVPDIESAIEAAKPSSRPCPRCAGVKLVETPFLPSANLLVDICPSCKGVFLDKGELRKVEALSRDRDVLKKVGRAMKEMQAKGFQIL